MVADDKNFPESLAAFVRGCISSVEQLAILLLLRANPQRSWTTAEVCRELRSSEHSATLRLSDLHDKGLIANRGGAESPAYVYAPSSDELSATIDAVAAAYAERPYAVIALIYSDGGPA
jgi:hypothetical protein